MIVPDQKVTAGASLRQWFRSERDSTLEAARSPLFIEVGECKVVVMAHVCPAVTKSEKV